MNANTRKFYVAGPVGQLECALDLPEAEPVGIALLAHPHPLYGGTMDNKVVHMMARAFIDLHYVSVRMNFRGVGGSQGTHAGGAGESDDMAVVLEHIRVQYPDMPVALGGYSFGTYVVSMLQKRLASDASPIERMVLVSATAGKWAVETVPKDTILIHGEMDDIVPLPDLFEWARPQDLPVVVVTGADHLFNRKLHHIREMIAEMWHR